MSAAHSFTPIAGQGRDVALLDAALLDGALERVVHARCARGAARRTALAAATARLEALRSKLDLSTGDAIAANLADLYHYMAGRLDAASCDRSRRPLDEVADLLSEIRAAWFTLPQDAEPAAAGRH
jgi:flagellar protein FliS